jgi:hypothetical protein
MASSGKRKTTMAKLNRERRLRERRMEKQAKRDLRKRAVADDVGEPSQAPPDEDQR